MTLADDLRAARALIDTPKAYFAIGLSKAIDMVAEPRTQRNRLMAKAIRDARKGHLVTNWAVHSEVMQRIDRAITNAETSHAE